MDNNLPTNPSNEPQTSNDAPPNPSTSLANPGKVIQPLSDNLAPQTSNNAPQEPNVAPESVAASNPASVSPNAVQATSQPAVSYLTGSQLQPEKKRMSVGVYIIAGFNFLGFVAGFFDSSQSSVIYSIAMFINLALAVGLIMRLQAARKFTIWVSGIILVITATSLLLLVGLQDRLNQRKADYEAAISKIDQRRITPTQKQQLETMNAAIATQERQAGKAITFTYFKLGATALESIAVIVYLTRPKVKEVFRELET